MTDYTASDLGTNEIIKIERVVRKVELFIEKCLNENRSVPPLSEIFKRFNPKHA